MWICLVLHGTSEQANCEKDAIGPAFLMDKHSVTQAMLDKCQMVLGIESAIGRNQLSTDSLVRFKALPNATGGLSAFPKHGDAREKMGSNSAL